jgi:hypothetical protein
MRDNDFYHYVDPDDYEMGNFVADYSHLFSGSRATSDISGLDGAMPSKPLTAKKLVIILAISGGLVVLPGVALLIATLVALL